MTDAQAQIREAIEQRIAAIRSKDAASAVFCVAEDVVALHHLTGKRVDRREVSLWMRSTLCFRREGGAWKIAHAHTSVPFHMDGSFRAAVDLAP